MKRSNPGLWAVAALCAAAPPSVQAQAAPETESTTLDSVIVTGRRTSVRLQETPQRIEVIDAQTLDATPARELTDVLKKNSSVDVIQYPGNLSGIGIRGFRPEFSGINKRSLLLIDGRPAMATNLSLVNLDQVERIEVLKGPASALYGSQAMGGVVNLITRESRGPLAGAAEIGLGQADTHQLKGRIGGQLREGIDFDYAGSWVEQDDFKTGGGQLRPNTAYSQQHHAARLGLSLGPDWRLNLKADAYRGRDIATPGDVAYGVSDQSNKDMDRHGTEARLVGALGEHVVSASVFGGRQAYALTKKTSRTASELAWLPFLSYEEDLHWSGLQVQDVWQWAAQRSLVFGVDVEAAKSVSRSYNPNTTRKAPFSADNTRDTTGVYANQTWTFNGGDSTVYAGVRHDRIRVETLDTPLKTGFTPSAATFGSTNPSAGFKHLVASNLRLHGTLGRGFVTPSASELTGEATSVVGGRNEITRGNPGLKPESSTSWDLGLEWSDARRWLADVTLFDTRVRDKIARDNGRVIDASNTVFTYVNATRAHMRGLELEGRWQINRQWLLSGGGTHYLHARQEITNGWEDINNVARNALRLGLDLQQQPWSLHLGARYRGRTKDQDWVNNSGRQIAFGGVTVWDLSGRWQLTPTQSLALAIDNLLDRDYAEKFGYPQPGRNLKVSYRHAF